MVWKDGWGGGGGGGGGGAGFRGAGLKVADQVLVSAVYLLVKNLYFTSCIQLASKNIVLAGNVRID